MRIKWLNEKRTRARLTRGFLFWKKTAIVETTSYGVWRYVATGELVDSPLSSKLHWRTIKAMVAEGRRARAAERADKERRNWT